MPIWYRVGRLLKLFYKVSKKIYSVYTIPLHNIVYHTISQLNSCLFYMLTLCVDYLWQVLKRLLYLSCGIRVVLKLSSEELVVSGKVQKSMT